ncbi:MAG: protein TolQ [gamma proteobacterium symbiont of Bathyaustriella thionipta]|nr:protein TolQ [gamma proteobacterium symbiont of Bathyaustriella thionipta]
MGSEISLAHLVLNASVVVQFVMALLLLASIISWTMIFDRVRIFKHARIEADDFENKFWAGGELSQLYRKLDSSQQQGMASIFVHGFREFARLSEHKSVDVAGLVGGAQRAMRVAFAREMDQLESHLPFLATVGSTSPYVGLFGTVWGIMHAFTALADVKQATLALVAPAIAEALIATAMGLLAAIPAVVAYNRFAAEVERLGGRYDNFLEEFSSILQRQAYG